MRIKLSRHAKRRTKLYGIPESIITDIVRGINLEEGEQEIIKSVEGFKYPLKIVVSVEKNLAIVITSYPLKKGKKK